MTTPLPPMPSPEPVSDMAPPPPTLAKREPRPASPTLPPATPTPDFLPTSSPPPPGLLILREILETIFLTLLIYAAVNFATGRFRVEGSSMEPSMHPEEYVLVDRLSYRVGGPQRGDVVVFQYPLATERDFIKRIIGLPGETVEISGGVVKVNGQALTEPYIAASPAYNGAWTLSPTQYFVLGDNRNSSSDSHSWGPLEKQYLIGRAVLIYWPPPLWGIVPHYTYPGAQAASSATPTLAPTPFPAPTEVPGLTTPYP